MFLGMNAFVEIKPLSPFVILLSVMYLFPIFLTTHYSIFNTDRLKIVTKCPLQTLLPRFTISSVFGRDRSKNAPSCSGRWGRVGYSGNAHVNGLGFVDGKRLNNE